MPENREIVRWMSWTTLAVLFLVLVFTEQLLAWLGLISSVRNALILILPLVLIAGTLEWLSRWLAQEPKRK